MTTFWSWFVTIVTLANILGCLWLIRWTAKPRAGEAPVGETTGHTWDEGALADLNNPMPRWWLWMFYGTIVFGLIYLALYPGLGNYRGLLGWTQEGQWEREMEVAEQRYGPIFAAYAERSVDDLARDPEAVRVGRRLFASYCSQCHGSDAQGGMGFPNLTDGVWQWGGEPEQIMTTLMRGRQAVMPALGAVLGDDMDAVVEYVMSLSGAVEEPSDPAGRTAYMRVCVACHGPEGKGNPMLGAPNLTDGVWLYGGSAGVIRQTIVQGRNGVMPAFAEFLGEDRLHVLTAYVYSLSLDNGL